MANRFVQAPSHGGSFRSGQPTLIVIHSLEAPARKGLAWDLANGWLQTAPVSPHSITDPVETVDCVRPGTIGWHCGNGNQKGVGLEVTGYAGWSKAQWLEPTAFAAVRLDAKRGAEYAKQFGIPLRWLSLNQIRNGEKGFCTHADISATLGGTNHWDPGPNFPYETFMKMVQQWAGQPVEPTPTPNPQPPGGPGGADPKDDDMAYRVLRNKQGTDYAVANGDAFMIRDPDHYHFLYASGAISTEHGKAPVVDQNLIDFCFAEAKAYAGRLKERLGN